MRFFEFRCAANFTASNKTVHFGFSAIASSLINSTCARNFPPPSIIKGNTNRPSGSFTTEVHPYSTNPHCTALKYPFVGKSKTIDPQIQNFLALEPPLKGDYSCTPLKSGEHGSSIDSHNTLMGYSPTSNHSYHRMYCTSCRCHYARG